MEKIAFVLQTNYIWKHKPTFTSLLINFVFMFLKSCQLSGAGQRFSLYLHHSSNLNYSFILKVTQAS